MMMAIAPEPLLSAYLAVLRDATIYARNGAVGDISPEKLGDLMDAVHNIPELLNRWEECDEPSLRSALESYDKRWVQWQGDLSLMNVLKTVIAEKKRGKNLTVRPKPRVLAAFLNFVRGRKHGRD
jgi:hypothetical protein